MEEKIKSLREASQDFKPIETKNIADMEVVVLDSCEFVHRKKINSNGEEYEYDAVIFKGEEYRVPSSVLSSIQAILKVKPSLKSVKVLKTGKGLETKYQVIPLD